MIMRMPWHKRHVKIMAQVYNEWTLQIEAPSPEAYVCLSDWIRLIHPTTGTETPGGSKPRRVGFTHTPPEDLGESEAHTERAGHD